MYNDGIITKTTGWLKPSQVNQYSKYGKVNQYTCYAYSDLFDVKKKDSHYAYIPLSGGVNSTHKSARVYCSGYGFQIPNNATITKILIRQTRCMGTTPYKGSYIKDYLIKLKTGASITDLGVGNNLSDGAIWNSKSRGFGTYESGDKFGTVQEVWGVNITPAVANNQNFGCVVQCIGSDKRWHQPKLDCVEMCIYYTQVNNVATAPNNTSKPENVKINEKEQAVQIESKIVTEYQPDDSDILQSTQQEISEDYVYSPFNLWVRYRNYVDINSKILLRGFNGVITVTLSNHLRFQNGSRTMKIPAFEFKQDTDDTDIKRGYKTVYQDLKIYPVKEGIGKVTVSGVHFTENDTLYKTQEIHLNITGSGVSLSNSMTDLKYCTFTDCSATKGSAICNLGAISTFHMNFKDLSNTDKCFYDFDKYRDSEYR